MIVAPSIDYFDYTKFNEQLKILNNKCNWLHINISDGYYSDDFNIGSNIFKQFRKNSFSYLDVHLMCDKIDYYINTFIKLGADGITIPFEQTSTVQIIKYQLNNIKNNYLKNGISIQYNTDIENVTELLEYVDLVLLESKDNNGNFNKDIFKKIEYLINYRKENNLKYLIEVEGGIDNHNAFNLKEKGVDIIVPDSYLFDGDLNTNIDKVNI